MAKRKQDSVVAPFIAHLWEMLGGPEHTRYIAWTTPEQDKAVSHIKIVDPEGFAKVVVPKYFNHRNIPSFVRQLNLYGFKKTSQGPNILEFSHPSFQRGHPENLSGCVRKRKKVEKKNAAGGAADDPQRIFSASFVSPTAILVAYGSRVRPSFTTVNIATSDGTLAPLVELKRVRVGVFVAEGAEADAAADGAKGRKSKRAREQQLGALDTALPSQSKRKGSKAAAAEVVVMATAAPPKKRIKQAAPIPCKRKLRVWQWGLWK